MQLVHCSRGCQGSRPCCESVVLRWHFFIVLVNYAVNCWTVGIEVIKCHVLSGTSCTLRGHVLSGTSCTLKGLVSSGTSCTLKGLVSSGTHCTLRGHVLSSTSCTLRGLVSKEMQSICFVTRSCLAFSSINKKYTEKGKLIFLNMQ